MARKKKTHNGISGYSADIVVLDDLDTKTEVDEAAIAKVFEEPFPMSDGSSGTVMLQPGLNEVLADLDKAYRLSRDRAVNGILSRAIANLRNLG